MTNSGFFKCIVYSIDLGILKSALSKYKLQIMNFKVKSRNQSHRKKGRFAEPDLLQVFYISEF